VAELEDLRRIAGALPGVTERPSYGTPSFHAAGGLVSRLQEDAEHISLRRDKQERWELVASAPQIYSVPEHFAKWPFVCAHLPSIEVDELAEVVEDAWRMVARKRDIAAYEERAGAAGEDLSDRSRRP
jgi:hypothetical protein